MDKDKENKIPMEQIGFALTGMSIDYQEDSSFRLILISLAQARMYFLTPKHAKRVYLALKKVVETFESQHGEIQAELPEMKIEQKKPVGFHTDDSVSTSGSPLNV